MTALKETKASNLPPIISVSGPPFERGRQHGSQCKKQIEHNIEHYYRMFEGFSNLDKAQVMKYSEKFLDPIKAFDKEMVEEMEGIAEGSGTKFLDILVINCRSELMFAAKKMATPECTSFTVLPEATSSGTTFIGQNRDFFQWGRKQNVILKIEQPNKPRVVMVIEAGLMGQMGFNSKGIGLVHNGLSYNQFQIGVPYVILRRGVLDAATLSGAVGKVLKAKRSSYGNFMIGHMDGEAINMETTPDDADFQYPEDGILTHSNHYLSARFRAMDTGRIRYPDTLIRRERLFKLLRSGKGKVDGAFIQKCLSDHFNYPESLCRHIEREPTPEDWETVVSLIMDLKNKKMILTEGLPCAGSYQIVDFKDFLQDTKK